MKIPKATKLPSGNWNVKLMVDGVRLSITEPTKREAKAKAAVKTGLQSAQKRRDITVGEAIDLYIGNKDAVLSPSTIAGYKKQRANTLQTLMDIPVANLTQEAVQLAVNSMAHTKSPKVHEERTRASYGGSERVPA